MVDSDTNSGGARHNPQNLEDKVESQAPAHGPTSADEKREAIGETDLTDVIEERTGQGQLQLKKDFQEYMESSGDSVTTGVDPLPNADREEDTAAPQ